jgi:hypothetical protein
MSKTIFKSTGALSLLMLLSQFSYAQYDTFDQYAPLGQRNAGLVVQANGTWWSEWATNPTSSTTADVTWGDPNTWPTNASTEEWEIKQNCSGGNAWVWVNAYRNDTIGARYPITTTRATYYDINSGQLFDITSGGSCGTAGQPYAVYNVYNSPYILTVWGTVNGTTSFFWQEKITQYQTVTNTCWQGPGSNTLTAIRQDEAWWDSSGGWAFGSSGSMSPTTGQPDGVVVNYGRYQTIAKGVGYAWTLVQYNFAQGCLQSQWSW